MSSCGEEDRVRVGGRELEFSVKGHLIIGALKDLGANSMQITAGLHQHRDSWCKGPRVGIRRWAHGQIDAGVRGGSWQGTGLKQ